MRRIAIPALIVVALSTVGCIDLEQEYTLNPDGSGKVAVRWVGSPVELGSDKGADARAKSILKDEVTKCEGVDTWKDVSCKARDDGKFEFRGTAYFKDFGQLKLHNSGFSMGGLKSSKDAAGNLVLVNDSEKESAPAKALSEEEAKKKLKEERAQYQQGKKMLEMMLADLKVSTKINLPGRVGQASNFKKDGDTAVRLAFEGKAFMKVLDELIMNDEWMLRIVRTGGLQDAGPGDEALCEKLFGEKGPVRAVTAGELRPRFDYESEAAPARKAWAEVAPTLGVRLAGPPAKGGDFKFLKVAGVSYVFDQGLDRELSSNPPRLTISLVGDLPGTVLSMKQGRLTTAVTDTGEDLLPDKFDRTIHFPRLSKDGAVVAFDVKLQLPSAAAKGLKEVSGVLTYLVGGKTKEVDLGFGELKPDAQGKGASIGKIEDSKWEEGSQSLEVKIEMSSDKIHSIVVKDASGAALKTTDGGSWNSEDQTTRTLNLKGKYPAKGKIVAIVYDDLKSYEIPFKIENVDLLGRPLK